MGYRSEVAIAFTDGAVRLLNAIIEHEPSLAKLVEDANYSDINENPDDLGGKLHWDYIKWYEDYEEIMVMETILTQIPDDDYHLIRLGEETSDIDERGHFFSSDMHVQRAIAW